MADMSTASAPPPLGRSTPTFLALPLEDLAGAALDRARQAGASHAEVRVERDPGVRRSGPRPPVSKGRPTGNRPGCRSGCSTTGPGASRRPPTLSTDAAARAAVGALSTWPGRRRRCAGSASSWPTSRSTRTGPGCRRTEINPFDVPAADRAASAAGAGRPACSTSRASTTPTPPSWPSRRTSSTPTWPVPRRCRNGSGSTRPPRRSPVDQQTGEFETMRTLAPPAGRGWEYLTGDGLGLGRRAGRRCPDCWPRRWPHRRSRPATTTWSSIPPTCGSPSTSRSATPPNWTGPSATRPPTPGTSFATFDRLGTLRYGSPVMHVTADRTVEHGLATVGWDDEGVAAQSWDLIRDGVLVGYQLDRRMAARQGFARSNGCAFADSSSHVPFQRMANVSLQPAPDGPSTEELIGAVGRRHLRRRRQELVDRHAAVQLPVHRSALLPHPPRAAGRPAARRGLPGIDHRVLGLHGGDRAVSRPTCSAGRSTAARASPVRWRR